MAKRKTLPAVRVNQGVAKKYKKRLVELVRRMNKSVLYWLAAEFKKQQPKLATDILPSRAMADKIAKKLKQWTKEFNESAETYANDFVKDTSKHVNKTILAELKKRGFLISKTWTRAEQDVLRSLIIENVSLIKSIPEQYFTQIQGIVQRAVQNGRDLQFLSDELKKRYEITERRAIGIARDQTEKCKEQLASAKYKAIGITKAVWEHNPVGKTYRDTHVEFDGQEFDLNEGLYDDDVGYNVTPGELPYCHCTFRAILPEDEL